LKEVSIFRDKDIVREYPGKNKEIKGEDNQFLRCDFLVITKLCVNILSRSPQIVFISQLLTKSKC
jgi:hypothetical protein